jgi:hypothetical protein
MTRTFVALCTALISLIAAGAAHAEGFIIIGGGASFPVGDADWEQTVESSPTLVVRGGGGRRTGQRSRLFIEGSFEYTPLTTNLDSALLQLDLSQYRALIGVRLESAIARGALVALRAGLGMDHLRAEVSSPLLPGSSTDTDTGVALDVGGGVWFTAGPVMLGVELALPIGFHDDQDANGANLDFRNTALSLLAGARFRL